MTRGIPFYILDNLDENGNEIEYDESSLSSPEPTPVAVTTEPDENWDEDESEIGVQCSNNVAPPRAPKRKAVSDDEDFDAFKCKKHCADPYD